MEFYLSEILFSYSWLNSQSFSFLKYSLHTLGLTLNPILEPHPSTLLKKMLSPFGFIFYTQSVTSVVVLLPVVQVTLCLSF